MYLLFTFNDKNFDKRVMLVKEPGDAHLTFIIKGADTYKQSFDISTDTRTVEDVGNRCIFRVWAPAGLLPSSYDAWMNGHR